MPGGTTRGPPPPRPPASRHTGAMSAAPSPSRPADPTHLTNIEKARAIGQVTTLPFVDRDTHRERAASAQAAAERHRLRASGIRLALAALPAADASESYLTAVAPADDAPADALERVAAAPG